MVSHPAESRSYGEHDKSAWQLAILSIVAAILPVLVFAREASPLLCVLLLATLVGAANARGSTEEAWVTLRRWMARPEAYVLIAALALLSVSALWSPATERGAEHAFRIVMAALLIAALLAFGSAARMEGLDRALSFGLAAGALLLLANLQFDGAMRTWMGFSPDVWRMNRAAVAIVLFLPLAVLLIWRLSPARVLAFIGICLAAVFLSQSESAQLAAIVTVAVWAVAALKPIVVHRLVGATMVAAVLAMPFVVPFANDLVPAAVHEKVGYGTLTIRGEIWAAFADLVPEKLLFGHGMEASSIIWKTPMAASLPQSVRDLLAFAHPHNAPLQVWFELGLVGAIFVAVLIVFALRAMERLPSERLSAATATTAAVFTVSTVSHGAWQSWWFCLVGLVAATYAMLPTRLEDHKKPRPTNAP
ncbi:MAG TPA: O-antigen ligase family protein [Hyphomicrobium sp.]|mgnify:CR=1 FL=1|uniref:O-antigen ligase family protein n=1 Tax=Hyphomicrobium sp. TaxID=82 RepID=UPI002B9168AE|nr:O-antigen ligase family protein [Hyphomicrobium sp.]HRN87715.1 O-antigen ligase family protein [Hyphomicrobium sp.]